MALVVNKPFSFFEEPVERERGITIYSTTNVYIPIISLPISKPVSITTKPINNAPQSLRLGIMNNHLKSFTSILLIATITDFEKIMESVNILHNRYYLEGVYYAEDYINLTSQSSTDKMSTRQITGLANHHYWDVSVPGQYFVKKYNAIPSDAIESFFAGITIADCGNMIQAVMYKYLLNVMGKIRFNQVFGSTIAQLVITQILFDPFQEFDFSSNRKSSLFPV